MKNVTLAIDEELIERGRTYAREHQTSLNALLRDLLRDVSEERESWLSECFTKMDRAKGHSRGKRWTREDLYNG